MFVQHLKLGIMVKKIGYIESHGVKYISVTDVFAYLREQGVIDTDKRAHSYRWNFEQGIIKLMHDAYKSGERTNFDVPFIIDESFYCHWVHFTYANFVKVIRAIRNETELKKVVYAIDLIETIGKNKMFLKRAYALK